MRTLKRQDRTEEVLPAHLQEAADKKQIANGYQKDSKQIANGYQKDSKQVANTASKGTEIDSKRIAGVKSKSRIDSKRIAKQIAEGGKNGYQKDSKQIANRGFETLVGHEKNLLLLIFDECLRTGNLTTPELTLDFLAQYLETSSGTVKSTIHRLVRKGFTWRESSKKGRGGWTKFGIEKSLYQDLRIRQTDSKRIANRYQKDSKRVAKQIAEQIAKPSSSSSGLNFKSTITSDEMWKTLDLSIVEKVGINQSAVFEARQKFGPFNFVDFEALIDRFSKYVVDPKTSRKISNPRGFFFGLCKQMQSGIEPLSEVETESDKAMKEYLLQSKAEKIAREQREREILELEFDKWFVELSPQEKAEIQPDSGLVKVDTPPYMAMFRDYFEKNLWFERRKTIMEEGR